MPLVVSQNQLSPVLYPFQLLDKFENLRCDINTQSGIYSRCSSRDVEMKKASLQDLAVGTVFWAEEYSPPKELTRFCYFYVKATGVLHTLCLSIAKLCFAKRSRNSLELLSGHSWKE